LRRQKSFVMKIYHNKTRTSFFTDANLCSLLMLLTFQS
jgi:hypothetical protein